MMTRHRKYIILVILLLCGIIARAQNRNNLIASHGKLILLVDLTSPKKDIDTILKRAGMPPEITQKFIHYDFSALINNGWVKVKQQNNVVQFNKSLSSIKANPPQAPYVLTTAALKTTSKPGYMDNALYGVNKFSTPSVYELPSGLTRFVLPGYLNARRVFLSGGFNDWSTLKGKMNKTATGWAIDIKLQPGAYMYKFIADSRWLNDNNNLIQLEDGAGNVNSVYYKYNYTFRLKGYSNAKKIDVAGSFTNFEDHDLFMEKKGDTWELPVYLHEGMHSYRFIIDGLQVADPANPNKFTDNDVHLSAVVNIGETTLFRLSGYKNAHSVCLVGDFNKWQPNNIELKKSADGWATTLILPAGNYDYKFIVDGDWILDPANPVHDVIDKQLNSFIAVKPNYTFKLKGYSGAKVVILSGTFNNWNQEGYRAAHIGDEWVISLHLNPGKSLYKYIVDDKWILDPGNKQWEDNEFDTGNSVLWIDR